ncbi:54S ribosomal protein L6 mitochondrial [Lithohypha guttulata]|uniref:54S ribosomal protein L6 mitochondrial n=2 Tax=Lithohypha guttulata TaxID=1690604 RepID=A0AAN7SZT9_9EURO|nr:54S ribosomal protein L6 mitochondrial [Lithohypha guttulata]KAK5085857.1 54S ribosomal protein L6 mitochondrial [Lithohypha guttulata]
MEVVGPQGQLTVKFPAYIVTQYDEPDRKVTISVADPEIKHQKSMWGTMRSHVQNSVSGVSEGHICILRLVGVGYRATIEDKAITKKPEYEGQKFVSLKLGFAHPVELGVPKGVKATVPQPTRILLEGPEKHDITQFAADIRKWRRPEPYKGKGIFVNDETIRLKAKKIK